MLNTQFSLLHVWFFAYGSKLDSLFFLLGPLLDEPLPPRSHVVGW